MFLDSLLEKIFGKKSQRDFVKLQPALENALEVRKQFTELTDQQLIAKTDEFRQRLADGETEDQIMPEAYGVVWDACSRLAKRGEKWAVWNQEITWDMIPYDVQIIGGIVLNQGKIAEMATGEGKTLVAVLPLYLNALSGKGAHLVTVNDYLARRDAEWMGGVLKFLGLSVGYIIGQMTPAERREAYNCDVTYGTNNEFGFDYLRDNMSVNKDQLVQRGFNFAIVDEVDSVLIDEARTPLIISGAVDRSTHKFEELKPRVEQVVRLQERMSNQWIADLEKAIKGSDESQEIHLDQETALKLLRVSRGAPKNKRYLKLTQVPGVLESVHKTEEAFMRDKAMWEADEDLFYVVEEKHNSVDLTEKGRVQLSQTDSDFFVLPDLAEAIGDIQEDESLSIENKADKSAEIERAYAEKNELISNVDQLLRAYTLFTKDDEYVIMENKIQIVDEYTGRLMPGRRYSDGLHQALEAKENVKVEKETQTLATVTLQNFFRMYTKLSGMTGTAVTEEGEFNEIYDLDVVEIPTNSPIRRDDREDAVYRSKKEKYNAIVKEVRQLHDKGLPVLVGTTTVEVSELISRLLKREGINHNVLNAKHHKSEADVVSEAGKQGAVTIATNMAGRGTDIKLNIPILLGLPEGSEYSQETAAVDGEPAGLHIIGTERHDSRRIDRQLRGRAGRQGDPGSSRFFLSLEDDLMRLFSSDRLIKIMDRLGVEDGEVITHSMVTKAIEKAAQRVEGHNFEIRKHLLEYDDVVNKQREVIYSQRREILLEEDISEIIQDYIVSYVERIFSENIESERANDFWDFKNLANDYQSVILTPLPIPEDEYLTIGPDALLQQLTDVAIEHYKSKEQRLTQEVTRQLERYVLLQTIDEHWKDHLNQLVMLRSGIGLRSYGQRDPLVEYKQESFHMFQDLMQNIEQDSVRLFFRAELVHQPAIQAPTEMKESHAEVDIMKQVQQPDMQQQQQAETAGPAPVERAEPKVSRNDPCPCGSGQKFKKCCGALN
jgi:preprotein translocase subunit SecA